jgi:hypothetical protein
MRRLYIEIALLCVLIAADVFYIIRSTALLNVGETTVSSAGFYPLLLGSVLGLLLIGCGVQVLTARHGNERIEIPQGQLVLATLVIVVCFTALWQFVPLGFYVAAFLLVFCLMVLFTDKERRFQKRSLLVNLAAAVGTIIAVYLIFDFLFKIPLTRG